MSDVKVTLGADSTELRREVDRASTSLRRFESQAAAIPAKMKQASSSMSGAGASVLALSNAVQDMSYGFRGALNNIPQLVMGLGGGMGLAGAAMGAGVAFDFFSRRIEESNKKMQAELDVMAQADPVFVRHIQLRQEAANAANLEVEKHNRKIAEQQEQYRAVQVYTQKRAAEEEAVNSKLREQIALSRKAVDQATMDPDAVRRQNIDELLEQARTTAMPTARGAKPGELKSSDDLKRLINKTRNEGANYSLAEQAQILEIMNKILVIEKESAEVEKERAKATAEKKAAQQEALGKLEQELALSKLVAEGKGDQVALFQKEVALRKEAADLAKLTGQAEDKILATLREKERNLALGEARAKEAPKRHFNAAESAARRAARVSARDRTGKRMSNTDKLALENEKRREQQRAERNKADAKETAAPGDKILQSILEVEKKQVEVWEKITSKAQ